MIIFPDIEIQNGRSVNRIRGQDQDPEVYDISPLDAALKFVAAGAERLHIIDLDSSLRYGHFNSELICEIINTVNVPVQVGGGIYTKSDVDWWFAHGAARVVIGTVAVVDRLLTTEVCGHYPGKIIISITGKDGYAMIDNWRTKTSFTALELAKSFENSGAGAIIYTDLDRFEGGQAVGLASTIEIGTQLGIPLISTGTVYTLDDVSTLSLLPNIEGVIIGRALFNQTVDLAEAIEAAATSRVAPELADTGVAPKLEEVAGIPIMKIDHVDIYTNDLDRSVKFYETLGFSFGDDRQPEEEKLAVMHHHSGITINLLAQKSGEDTSTHMALEVSSLTQTRAFLEYNDIDIAHFSDDGSKRTVFLKDPDNNLIELDHYR